ncbi:hypothetical protein SAMN05421811_12126 [Nonomuraea wenchangensis]|uniref:Uncharacterized protein n=1 Tax=Nonomuraea wenchangensis TaxID=568860 RepID=A0A1I0LQI2_9ACTN|nr:hypothetical protein SAMN05421811_12126 [Nonomuraea wenchangensis]
MMRTSPSPAVAVTMTRHAWKSRYGFTRPGSASTTTMASSAIAVLLDVETYAPARFSATPSASPPTNAPITLENPPSVAATKPLMSRPEPFWSVSSDAWPWSSSAIVAIAPASAHEVRNTVVTETPSSRGVTRSSAMACMRTPSGVRKNSTSATVTASPAPMLSSCS